MKLIDELKERVKEFKTDGYPMSIGEIINLYENREIIINPKFQRYFRWTDFQKSRLIESIFLGIPTPAIFVYQREDGVWELVDGLQRISTILEFVGKLRDENQLTSDGKAIIMPKLKLKATKLLPSFQDVEWEDEPTVDSAIPRSLQLDFKRSKIKVEIIQKESDVNAKFEVFERLNTGGTFLSPQEVRNCVLVMLREEWLVWLESLSKLESFQNCIPLTDRALDERYDMELALKYLGLMRYELQGRDVTDFLNDCVQDLFNVANIANNTEFENFKKLFDLLNAALGESSFRRFQGQKHTGRFLDSAFEPITIGLGSNLSDYDLSNSKDIELIKEKIESLWELPDFLNNMGSGSNAKIRIPRLIALGKIHFKK
ncbi:DUF262 domain-containing protein [Undibacterium sp. CY21W]|uniref:GmrSD restriction endonuclease domain-containing protein n=1 Tax=Undibacterium sp. CY21W TaxID=2762293 RepID=UPI00164B719D|nr:DUF262 domain-containing protein [Undibacterium sp. CY21W]MBC3929076.1 DUF262 domain-containing protein [Undibacterium sp. CY21W]